MMGVLTLPTLEDLDVPDVTFERPGLTTFARLDELGLEVVGQRLEPDRAVLSCRVVDPDGWCRRCGCEGVARDTVAMDGFTGFKTATTEELPDAVPVMDPFHVVRLARPSTSAADESSRPAAVTVAARATRSTAPAAPCTPVPTCSPTNSNSGWRRCSSATRTCGSKRPGASTSA
jgi:Transposase